MAAPTRPTFDPLTFATTGTPTAAAVTPARRANGYAALDIPGHLEFNRILYELGQWSDHYGKTASLFTTLEDLVGGLDAGETAILDEKDTDQAPGTAHTVRDLSLGDVGSVAVTGSGVVYCERNTSGKPEVKFLPRDLDTGAASVVTFTTATTANAVKVVSDGAYVVIALGNIVECFDIDGTSNWTYDHGATVNDLALTGGEVIIVGAEGTTPACHVRSINLSAGTATWSYRHSAGGGDEVDYVATDGQQIIIIGDASSYTSTATVRSIQASNGFDAAGEGGLGTSTEPYVWDSTAAGYVAVAMDDRELFTASIQSSKNVRLHVLDKFNGTEVATRDLTTASTVTSINAISVDVDQDMVVVAPYVNSGTTYGPVFGVDRRRLAAAWVYQISGIGNPREVATDGAAVFVVFEDVSISPDQQIARLYRGNRPGLWRRADPTNGYLPMRQLAIPGGPL